MRFFERAGTQRVSSMAARAVWRSVSPPPRGEGLGWGPAASAAERLLSASDAAGPPPCSSPTRGGEMDLSIGMHHCGVARKITLALDRHVGGYLCWKSTLPQRRAVWRRVV